MSTSKNLKRLSKIQRFKWQKYLQKKKKERIFKWLFLLSTWMKIITDIYPLLYKEENSISSAVYQDICLVQCFKVIASWPLSLILTLDSIAV